jgi:acetylornithine deacetylase/succinyl-diaminopimelate desuccinylase-like protein
MVPSEPQAQGEFNEGIDVDVTLDAPPIVSPDENRAHGRDERIGIQAFDESVEFTYRLVKAMSSSK